MQDQPRSEQLVTAVCHWLETQLLPTLEDPRLRFQTHVSLYALRIVEREIPREEADLHNDLADLSRLLNGPPLSTTSLRELQAAVEDGHRELCARIRQGQFDQQPQLSHLLQQLRPLIERKLEVCQPR